MPGGDRTGPMGLGPRTGRGLGFCSGRNAPGWTYGPGRGMGRGFRGGFGRGFGRGWGRGRGWWGCWWPAPYYGATPAPADPATEKEVLKNEAEFLRSRLEEIEKRLAEIEK